MPKTHGERIRNSSQRGCIMTRWTGVVSIAVTAFAFAGNAGDGKVMAELKADTKDNVTLIDDKRFKGEITDGKLVLDDGMKVKTTLTKVERKSETLGKKPPEGAVVLFDGKSADEWEGGKIVE